MNPLLAVISLLTALRSDLYQKFNAAMEKAKPLEQFEAGTAARGILNEIDWAKDRLERSGQELQAALENAGKFLSGFEKKAGETPEMTASRFFDEFIAKNGSDVLAAAIAEKKVISMDDHNNALTAARDTASTEARSQAETEFNARLEKIQLVATRRSDAVTRVGEVAAATLSEETLAGDGFDAALTALEGRISKLKDERITPDGPRHNMFANLIAKQSEEEFQASLGLILDAAGGKLPEIKAADAGKQGGPKLSIQTAAPFTAAASGTDRKKLVI